MNRQFAEGLIADGEDPDDWYVDYSQADADAAADAESRRIGRRRRKVVTRGLSAKRARLGDSESESE